MSHAPVHAPAFRVVRTQRRPGHRGIRHPRSGASSSAWCHRPKWLEQRVDHAGAIADALRGADRLLPTPSRQPHRRRPRAAGPIVLAGLSSVIDKPSQTIDASTFGKTFPSETSAIYILYQLSPGSSGVVQSTWNHGTVKVNADSFTYPADAPWAYFVITYKNGFIPGDYDVVLKVVSTGDTMTLPFTITGPRKAPPTPTPVPSGTSAFTLTTMASAADSSKSGPDETAFTTTFLSSAPKLYVVFRLRSGLSGKVVCTMSANGSDVIKPITLSYSVGNSWGDFAISSSGSFPTGDYVATLTFSPSAEAVTIHRRRRNLIAPQEVGLSGALCRWIAPTG